MSGEFAARVVLVTGASRGLGRATAKEFLARGASVAVHARTAERAHALERELGEGAYGVHGDLRHFADARGLVQRTVDHFGRLDVLVNNAAVAYSSALAEIPEHEWRETLDVNLSAAFFCLQAAVPVMTEQKFGRIVNVSSTAGRSVSTLAGAHYTASKAGLIGLTRHSARELGPLGITVNAICPGLFDTELARANATDERLETLQRNFPVRRLGRPEEVAALICFVASEMAGYVNGAALDINGGSLML
jgi:3-oxoacyl-[acyl-carrier protein] reductase